MSGTSRDLIVAKIVWRSLRLLAKAAETKAKADDAAKKDAVQLGKAQDKAAANYRKNKGIKSPPSSARK